MKESVKNLKEYIEEDEIYQNSLKENLKLSDFEQFCVNHCADIDEVISTIEYIKGEIKIALDTSYYDEDEERLGYQETLEEIQKLI